MKHPSDGALEAILDGAAGSVDETRLEAHVRGCPRCRDVMTTLAQQRLLVGALLDELDAPIPVRSVEAIVSRVRRRRRRHWQLVATAASLFAVAVASATMRSYLLHDGIGSHRPAPPPASAQVPTPGPAAVEAPTVIAMEPTDDLQIEFAAAQTEGELLVTLGPLARVTLTASEPVPYTLGRGRIAVDNAGSRASYRLALPERVGRAAIRVGGRLLFTKRGASVVTQATREGADTFRLVLVSSEARP